VYIVTFYSFKGGVGRTMALVNVGAELARTGARVLLVDFDLEAPSLMNFNLAGTKRPTKGLIDYVLAYQASNQAPIIDDYICESEAFPNGGRLAIMPAGASGPDYPQRLMSINWQKLYSQQSGFLLFEDLKAQWKEQFRPDYVLIDSRTGHNEVMGISTRQLPDAVCAVFLPNEQNLEGLAHVVATIRQQKQNSEGRDIKLHFVVSNVPYADDERGTLETALARYRERLNIQRFDIFLHHYPTLALLGQDVFVLNSSKLPLAQEYRDLSDAIRLNNLQDRSSALKYLRDIHASLRAQRDSEDLAALPDRLSDITRAHAADAEVLFWLARVKRQLGAVEEATVLLDRSIDQDPTRAQAYIDRASLRLRELDSNRLMESRQDFLSALDHSSKPPHPREVAFTIRSLVTLGDVDWQTIAEKPAIRSLNAGGQIDLTVGLDISDSGCEARYRILNPLPHLAPLTPSEKDRWRANLSLACIRLRRYEEAVSTLWNDGQDPDRLDEATLFNAGIALWGQSGHPTKDFFIRVLSRDDRSNWPNRDANYFQCLAIASMICENSEAAREYLDKARSEIRESASMAFSAWRYLRINPIDFDSDLDEIGGGIESGLLPTPLFMR
jgi:cellulose biosynthesis protein BcsQ